MKQFQTRIRSSRARIPFGTVIRAVSAAEFRWILVAILLALTARTVAEKLLVSAATLQTGQVTTVSAASYSAEAIAPESIVAAFGSGLAPATQSAASVPLPTELAGVSVEVNNRKAGLFFVSPLQINYLIPAATEIGTANVIVKSGSTVVTTGTVQVRQSGPAIFTANSTGQGVPAAYIVRVKASGAQSSEPLSQFDPTLNSFITRPVDLGPSGDVVFLVLFVSGVSHAPDPNQDGNVRESVKVIIEGREITPTYAGRQGGYTGLDQINAEIPRTLLGQGFLSLRVSVTGANDSNSTEIELAVPAGSGPTASYKLVRTDEDKPVSFTLSGNDPQGKILSYKVVNQPGHGKLSGMAPALTYAPDPDYNGADTLRFVVSNGEKTSLSEAVLFSINPVNDPPVLTVSGPQTMNAEQTVRFILTATDVDGDALKFSAPDKPTEAVLDQTSPASALLTWTPLAAQSNRYVLKFRVEDSGSPPLGSERSVTLTVSTLFAKTSGPEGADIGAFLADGPNLFATTYGGGVFLTTNNGRSWSAVNTGLSEPVIPAIIRSGQNLFVGTGKAGVFVSSDNGQSWRPANKGIASRGILSLAAAGSTITAGTGAAIYYSDDQGQNWTKAEFGGQSLVYALAASGNSIFAGTTGDGLFVSRDNGRKWSQVSGLSEGVIHAVHVSTGKIYLGTTGGVYVSGDQGVSWTRFVNGPRVGPVFSLFVNGSNLYAGTPRGVYLSTDGGQNWSLVNAGLPSGDIYALASIGTNVFAGNFGGGVFVRAITDQQWGTANTGLTSSLVNALVTDGSMLFAGNGGSGISASVNNGQSWTPASGSQGGLIGSTRIFDLAISGNNLVAATDSGVWISADKGRAWALSKGLTSEFIVLTLGSGGGRLFAGAVDGFSGAGGLYVSTDNGQNWTLLSNGSESLAVTSVAVLGSKVFAGTGGDRALGLGVGFFGGAGVFVSDGQKWINASDGLPKEDSTTFRGINSLATAGNKLFAGTTTGVYVTNNEGRSWSPAGAELTGRHIISLRFSNSRLYAATSGGAFVSGDEGQNWTAIDDGITNRDVTSLLVRGDDLFLGTSGGVYSSISNGYFWSLPVKKPTSPMIYAVILTGENVLAGTGSGVFISADQGQNWSPASPGLPQGTIVYSLARGASDAEIYAGTAGQGVFRSIDSGQTWTQVNTGLTNLTVYSIVVSGSVFVATDSGVFRSDNQGQTWAPASQGLTNLNVLSLAVSGTTLYAGTDGGGVFISNNQGGNWTAGNNGLTARDVRSILISGATIFAGTLKGGIFRSGDGGRNWLQVNTGLKETLPVFSFVTGGTRIYAATIYGVFVTGDQGANWRQINAGLREHIEVRSLVTSGDKLIAGTFTSGLFISRIPE